MGRSWLLVLGLAWLTGAVAAAGGEPPERELVPFDPVPLSAGLTTPSPLLGELQESGFGVRREAAPWRTEGRVERTGARFGFGSGEATAGGISWREVQLFEALPSGEQSLLKGHVLAADLRLELGDNSVLLEYAQSVLDRQVGEKTEPAIGREVAASVLRRLNDQMTLNVGFRRLTSSFSPLSGVIPGVMAPDMVGIEAGFSWRTPNLGFESRGAIYRPEGEPVGYANRFGAAIDYSISEAWRVDVGYQSLNRRRLANLEDAWTNIVTGGLQFGGNRAFRANLNYRFDLDQTDTGFAERGHAVGASLELGF